eukprot:Skav231873  [mRNA]  locus=scaffold54:81843:85169:- [translate_table: standard]
MAKLKEGLTAKAAVPRHALHLKEGRDEVHHELPAEARKSPYIRKFLHGYVDEDAKDAQGDAFVREDQSQSALNSLGLLIPSGGDVAGRDISTVLRMGPPLHAPPSSPPHLPYSDASPQGPPSQPPLYTPISRQRIFEEECVADGYTMPAGCIKVSLENGSVKYVMPNEVANVLRPRRADAGAARLEARDRAETKPTWQSVTTGHWNFHEM